MGSGNYIDLVIWGLYFRAAGYSVPLPINSFILILWGFYHYAQVGPLYFTLLGSALFTASIYYFLEIFTRIHLGMK